MMRAEIRELLSPDVDLETFEPEDPEDVGIWVQITVGAAGEVGGDLFDVMVCTPRWLEAWVREHGPLNGRHHLIVERFDASRIKIYLSMAVEEQEAPTWAELSARIGRFAHWEFEDYRPYEPSEIE